MLDLHYVNHEPDRVAQWMTLQGGARLRPPIVGAHIIGCCLYPDHNLLPYARTPSSHALSRAPLSTLTLSSRRHDILETILLCPLILILELHGRFKPATGFRTQGRYRQFEQAGHLRLAISPLIVGHPSRV
jgi:hypothetical protein